MIYLISFDDEKVIAVDIFWKSSHEAAAFLKRVKAAWIENYPEYS